MLSLEVHALLVSTLGYEPTDIWEQVIADAWNILDQQVCREDDPMWAGPGQEQIVAELRRKRDLLGAELNWIPGHPTFPSIVAEMREHRRQIGSSY